MSASKFKFISPGVFLEEIDQSRLPTLPDVMGPMIIGTSDKGPGFQPVRLTNITEEGGLNQVFGQPSSGSSSDDPARFGVHSLGVDYGAWAAQAYLANNSPVTFLRLLGSEHPNATSNGRAGWSITPDDADTGGAYGLFVSAREDLDSVTIPAKQTKDDAAAHVVTLTVPDLTVAGGQNDVVSVVLRGAAIGDDDLILTTETVDLREEGGTLIERRDDLATAIAAVIDGDATADLQGAAAQGAVVTITGPANGDKFEVIAIDEPATVADVEVAVDTPGVAEAVIPTAGAVVLTIDPADDDEGANVNAGDAVTVAFTDAEVALLDGKTPSELASLIAGFLNGKEDVTSNLVVTSSSGSISITPKVGGTKITLADTAVGGTGGSLFELVGVTSTGNQPFGALAAVVANGRQLAFATDDQFGDAYLTAIIHATNDTDIRLATSTAGAANAGLDTVQASDAGLFTLAIINAAAGSTELKQFSLDYSLAKAIREVLNTDPTATNTHLNASGSAKHYWLAESFEGFLRDEWPGMLGGNMLRAQLKKITNGSSYLKEATSAETPWIRSQHLGRSSEWSITNTKPLFKIIGLDTGEAGNYYSVSIEDISVPVGNAKLINPYCSFNVVLRDWKARPVKVFESCNLNPSSPSYVARKIGDQHHVWSHEKRRLEKRGMFPNMHPLIRVQVSDSVASGAESPSMVPCAYEGPATASFADGFGTDDSVSVKSPSMRLRPSSTGVNVEAGQSSAIFGVESHFSGSETLDPSYIDLTKPLSDGAALSTSPSFVFSLELIKSGIAKSDGTQELDANDNVIDEANACFFYDLSGRVDIDSQESENGQGTFNLFNQGFIALDGSTEAITSRVGGFAVPFTGGFDGFDIREADPVCERILADSQGSATNSSAYYTISKALSIVSDPEFVEYNLLSAPGVTLPGLTDQMMRTAEARGDALAVIDLPNIYTPSSSRYSASEQARVGDMDLVVSAAKGRAFNNSYGCAYAPWVMITGAAGQPIWLPPSVAAIGTMGSSSAISEVWFAPAGFNRGGLHEGSAGLAVRGVSHHLTSKDRDNLYDVAINPIASFPSENIVIFGQKTLQGFPSALDRINVRRLLIHVKKRVSQISRNLLFEPNIEETWLRFKLPVQKFLGNIQSGGGLTDYRVVLDSTTTTPDLIDRNILYAKVLLKPARSIEFIAVDFMITNTGASFDD